MHAAQVRNAYDAVAERYVALFGSSDSVHVDDLDLITRRLSIRPGVVLDAGGGPGHLTAHLSARAVDAVGIDLVPAFIEHARLVHPDGRFALGSMGRLPLVDRSVAGVLAWFSLIHVHPDDLGDTLVELRRVLVPGGTIVAGFFDGDELLAFDHKVVTAFTWPVEEMSARLARAGFREVERLRRPGGRAAGTRACGAIAAIAD